MTFLLLLKKYWAQILTGIGILILLVVIAGVYQNCKPQPHLDLESVQKINVADEVARKEELKKKLEENANIIKSTRENTNLIDLSIEEKNKQIAEKVEEANKQIEVIKEQGRDVTSEELECILIPEHCQ